MNIFEEGSLFQRFLNKMADLLILNIINGSIKEMKRYRLRDYLTMAGLGFLGLFLYSALYYYGIGVLGSQEACILNYLCGRS